MAKDFKCFQQSEDETELRSCCGYKLHLFQCIVFCLCCVMTGGLLALYCAFKKDQFLKWTHRQCTLFEAMQVLIHDLDKQLYVSVVKDLKLPASTCDTHRKTESGLKVKVITEDENANINRYFEHKFRRYFIQGSKICRLKSHSAEAMAKEDYVDTTNGLTCGAKTRLNGLYGNNVIDIPKGSYGYIFVSLVANPFYAFQLCAVILWSFEGYQIYSGFVAGASLLSIFLTMVVIKRQKDRLRKMVGESINVKVWRRENEEDHGEEMVINSHDLVPGDLLTVEDNVVFPCDALLITGTCVVNEGMLTGESVPVLKVAQSLHDLRDTASGEAANQKTASNEAANHKTASNIETNQKTKASEASSHKTAPNEAANLNAGSDRVAYYRQQTIFNGTHVLEARSLDGPSLAIVLRSGFDTAKGEIVRGLVLPKRIDFHYIGDFLKFIMCLAVPALIGSIYTFYNFFVSGTRMFLVIVRALSILTSFIPPDLPIILAFTLLLAWWRLAKNGIRVTELPRISLAGRISCFCFDKTGTLTEEDLILKSVLGVNNARHLMPIESSSYCSELLIECMSCCHSLVAINDVIEGDSLEKELLFYTGARLLTRDKQRVVVIQNEGEEKAFEILKIFPFDSSICRMSCVARNVDSKVLKVYAKGAPEVVAKLCVSASLPDNLKSQIRSYTRQGSRVLAIAFKTLEGSTELNGLSRDNAEGKLTFGGLLVYKSKCRSESRPTILELKQANIRTVMVTGDHLLTALHVAKETDIIAKNDAVYEAVRKENDVVMYLRRSNGNAPRELVNVDALPHACHLICTGDIFHLLSEQDGEAYEKILLKGTVFARMSPEQKTELVRGLKSLDYCVGMCGDGANDCGALKTADVGISLSTAEASVVAPFTSQTMDISCCPKLIKNGRTALVNVTMTFSCIMVQGILFSLTVILLSEVGSGLSDLGQMYSYFLQLVPISLTMILGKPAFVLHRKKPHLELFRLDLIIVLLSVILLMATSSLLAFFFVQRQDWYRPPSTFDNSDLVYNFYCFEQGVTFSCFNIQLTILFLILYKGHPHKESLYKNFLHIAAVGFSVIFNTILILAPTYKLRKAFMLVEIPRFTPRFYILLFPLCAGIISGLLLWMSNGFHSYKTLINMIRRKKTSRKKYKRFLKEEYGMDFEKEREFELLGSRV